MGKPALVIGIASPKGMKDTPMGGGAPNEKEEEDSEDSRAEDGSETLAALGEAYDAIKSGDRETAIDAWNAAITAKVTDLLAEKE